MEELKKREAEDIPVIGGGVIPEEDIQFLLDHGIQKIFTPGTPMTAVADFIEERVQGDSV